MKLLSLNTGEPKAYDYNGTEVFTSIYKTAIAGERKVSFLNIEGDKQSDLKHHGGKLKAIYAYDISYYQHWKNILERETWEYGLFGENLTTEGLTDDNIIIGNIYRIGSVYIKAIQPRFPCFKLNIRFNDDDMINKFITQMRHGTYFSVVQEGSLKAGDSIEMIERSSYNVTIQQLVESYYNKGVDKNIKDQILAIDFLPDRLRKSFESFQ